RALKTEDLLDCLRRELGLLSEQPPLIRVLGEEKEPDTELVPRRVVAREEQRRDQRSQLRATQTVAAVLRLDERGHEVVFGMLAALGDELLDVRADADEP